MSNWWRGIREAYGIVSEYQSGFSRRVEGGTFIAQPENVMSVGVEIGQAMAWTVNLNSFRYSAGVVLNDSPTDNQVGSVLGVPPLLPAVSGRPVQAEIVWGVANATERCRVDWPQKGGTFQIHASVIRVALIVPTAIQGSTTLSGFVAPSGRSIAQQGTCPTFTIPPVGLIALGSAIFPLPDRAIAYRSFYRVKPTISLALDFRQTDATHAAVCFDTSKIDTPDFEDSNLAGWIPLRSWSQFVEVTNTDAVSTVQVGIQFLLDLG
jgi:hypothetical protein